MRGRYLLCGAAALTLAGCANLFSISRETDVVSTSYDDKKGAKAIHLDAPQRLVFSDTRALCAEPSPDALTALAASASAGITLGQNAGSVAQAINQTAASIGLRTQSITLMRDSLYRMCEAYHNYALGDDEYMQLLQRTQDLTLGVLAIEQLTGVAAANQAALGGNANADAASALQTTQEMVDKFKKQEEEAREEKEKADQRVAATKKQISEFPKTPPEGTTEEEHKKNKDDLDKQLVRDEQDQKAKGEAVAQAQKNRELVERNRDAAFAKAHAAASGAADLSAPTKGGQTVDTTGHIAKAVGQIVDTVVGKNHVIDNCMAFLMNNTSRTKRPDAAVEPSQTLNDICNKVITADIAIRDRESQAQAEAYKNYFKGPLPRHKPGKGQTSEPPPAPPPPSGATF